ncbi:MAG: aminotransferase class I/II-fold pyridoxal phosphate-dependent enzyme [Thermoanaerobaculia bacterium]
MSRVYLSPPHLGERELELVVEAFASNWIAPLGPQVDAFERELGRIVGVPHVAALSSGTAALHLALRLLGVGRGDRVLCSDLTFAASAFAIRYQGAEPVFIDADAGSWQMDPRLLAEELAESSRHDALPKAAIVVDLYGQCADWDEIESICADYGVPLIEDAAEALGATYRDRPAGCFGRFGVLSFNGNKIVTTSGGGALVSADGEAIQEARRLASQAREPLPHYEHTTIGFNYRLSNLLAAVGRGQLTVLAERVAARRRNFELYSRDLSDLPGVDFMPEATTGRSNRWLTCLTIDPSRFGADREEVRTALEGHDIEARPVWKPMHLQPVFEGCSVRGGAVSERLFDRGLCLPSGSSLRDEDRERVVEIVRSTCREGS